MGLEAATYISDLVATNPAVGDAKAEGDDHLRLIKAALKTTWAGVTGAVTATHADMALPVDNSAAVAAGSVNWTKATTLLRRGIDGVCVYTQTITVNNVAASTALIATLPVGYRPNSASFFGAGMYQDLSAATWIPVTIQVSTAGVLSIIGTPSGFPAIGVGDVVVVTAVFPTR